MKQIVKWMAVVACMAPSVAMANGLTQARQQQGGELAQHLGSGWRFDAGSCDLILEEAAGHNLTIIPMKKVASGFGSEGATVACPVGAPCVVRKMDGQVVSTVAKRTLVPGATWASTHAANLAERTRALCQLPATATAAQVQATAALNSVSVRAFILSRREAIFSLLRPRLNDTMRFTASTCVAEEPRSGGAVATIPVRDLGMRPDTTHAQGITFNLQCSTNQPCIKIQGGPSKTANDVSWPLKGTTAQQASVTPNFIELKRLCVFDHQLPPVIN